MKIKHLVFLAIIITTSVSNADWQWQRVQCSGGCGYTYQKVNVQPQVTYAQPQVQQKTETQTTVVNNLVGIPVPVTYNQPIQAQGSTVYGYSSVAEAYGKVDLGLLYNQAARLTDQAQQLAGQASSDFATLVQAEGQNRAEVARILAQGQSARQALEAAAGTGNRQYQQVQQRAFTFRVTQTNDGQLNVQQIQDGDFQLSAAQSTQSVSSLLKNKCVSCHGNGNSKGGLNLEQAISGTQQAKILNRITTDDLSTRMPQTSAGVAGQKLNPSEIQLLRNAMGE